ncbi:amidophosphoribosyltransferase [bacterium]|nr:amidophosphoribosyltransferase [bacterium]MBU1983958.1 amidophosphoribosyltransferase [bacterium]
MGVFGHPHAAELTYLGLFALQHRGQESAGIVSSDGSSLHAVRGMGLVADVFNDQQKFQHLAGNRSIGHVRYSTTGGSVAGNVQPLVVRTKDGPLAVAHNGNLVNARALRVALESEGAIFQTDSDSEIFVHLISRSREATLAGRIAAALSQVQGAYSLLFLTKEEMVIVRDPHGFRPLCLGGKGDAIVAASETCALDLTEATYVREIEPGEIVTVSARGIDSTTFAAPSLHMCVFELIYFARPDSQIFGGSVDRARRKLGKILAEEAPAEADIVIAVPDSSNTSALGYARAGGLKFELGLIRNHYIGRTFINPSQFMRSFNARVKYNPVVGVLKDKRVVIVEDSIVRGTTLKKLVALLRRVGVKEIHVRVASPPIQYPCFYGMDFPTRNELIAAWNSPEQIREYLGVDSLKYLSVEGMLAATYTDPGHFCTACFTGEYPVPLSDDQSESLFQYSEKEWARAELERVLKSFE